MAQAEDIDPQLPFLQIHRSAVSVAAQLAQVLGLSAQTVIGSLVLLWHGMADRRFLGRHLKAGAVLLSAADVEARLCLAFGCRTLPAPLSVFEAAGVLELVGDLYRVRGMSRYIEAELARLRKKETAAQKPPGWNKPRTQDAPRVQPGSDQTEVRGERREVRGERREVRDPEVRSISDSPQKSLEGLEKAPTSKPKRKPSAGERAFEIWKGHRLDLLGGVDTPDADPHPAAVNTWWTRFEAALYPDGKPDTSDEDRAVYAGEIWRRWAERATWSQAKGYPFTHLLMDKSIAEAVAMEHAAIDGEAP